MPAKRNSIEIFAFSPVIIEVLPFLFQHFRAESANSSPPNSDSIPGFVKAAVGIF